MFHHKITVVVTLIVMLDATELALLKGIFVFGFLMESRKGILSDQGEMEEKQFCGGSLKVPLANTAGY